MKYQGDWIAATISLRSFQWFQYVTVTALVFLGTFHYIYIEYSDPNPFHRVTRLFDVGKEASVTTAFATLNLFVSSILLYAIYCLSKFRCDKVAVYWLILCVIFVMLSVDETASIHERMGPLNRFIGLEFSQLTYNKWVVSGAIFTGVVFLFFIPFLLSLPRKTALLILLSGGIFVSGALGLEFLGALMLNSGFVAGRHEFIYEVRRLFEEGFELYGIALFNCTLFAYLTPSTIGINFAGHADQPPLPPGSNPD